VPAITAFEPSIAKLSIVWLVVTAGAAQPIEVLALFLGHWENLPTNGVGEAVSGGWGKVGREGSGSLVDAVVHVETVVFVLFAPVACPNQRNVTDSFSLDRRPHAMGAWEKGHGSR